MLDETALIPSEPVTVVLSEMGWIRAAKGHEIDGNTLSYKQGDKYQASALGRSNQQVVLLDSSGRSYTLAAHSLPSARGQGDPLSGRFSTPVGATFKAALMAKNDEYFLLGSNFGYGFICQFEDMLSRAKAGKASVSLGQCRRTNYQPLKIQRHRNRHDSRSHLRRLFIDNPSQRIAPTTPRQG